METRYGLIFDLDLNEDIDKDSLKIIKREVKGNNEIYKE